MSGNTVGKLFTVTSFGESHGPAIGCVIDGCPPGLALSVEDMQRDLEQVTCNNDLLQDENARLRAEIARLQSNHEGVRPGPMLFARSRVRNKQTRIHDG